MKVLKFGGSSVGTPERIKSVIDLFIEASQEEPVVVVVSAFQGITDQLIQLGRTASQADASYHEGLFALKERHEEAIRILVPLISDAFRKEINNRWKDLDDALHGVFLIRELSLRTLDSIMSFGELLSASIIAQAAREKVSSAKFLDTRSIIKTDSRFGSARVLFDLSNPLIQREFENDPSLRVATGFIGSGTRGETTTLGRGGSDYTASILAAALNASEIQIWTDVDGVMTGDPNKIPNAFSIHSMTYEEAMEMSHFGAKIIHPPTMQPALDRGIPIRIKNTFHPDFSGTVISDLTQQSEYPIKGLSSIPSVSLLTVQGSGLIGIAGISSRLFSALAKKGISVILITQASSEHSICIAVDPKQDEDAKQEIEQEFSLEILARQVDPVVLERNLSIMAVVGDNMRHTPGISGRLFQALGNDGVNVIAVAQGSSERNISIVISDHDEGKALRAVHDTFFFPASKRISVFVAGPGLVGSTLLNLIQKQQAILCKEKSIDVRVIGISNSTRMIRDASGIHLSGWRETLAESVAVPQPDVFAELFRNAGGVSVFVDCTASDTIRNIYPPVLASGISIVTANKKALTGPYPDFANLRNVAKRSGARLLYETTVGAGLPVIQTLKDLLLSGDRVLKVEAILSGTLSYLFNSFSTDLSFGQLVHKAKELGYTEPDPRDDLNGADVARKLLILARTIGWPMEMSEIEVQNLVPESCRSAATIEEFFLKLEEEDSTFEKIRSSAAGEGKVLRYIAVLQNGKATVSLQSVGTTHPFYSVFGNDNVIAFTTERYVQTPLVIRGPGAGAEVTAAGVLADILRL
ncbi:MAG TPA: bifunctional aspartate kinase/homoserine dehydrogenase I [Acidobacteriota bacterium]|nr:bifunctional aspartate kinase/homoserine dehydrogenase I [Acidobacteriota bacterium]